LLPAATEAQNPAPRGIAGFLDPTTGTFTARPALLPGAASLQRSGTIIVTVTAVLGPNISPSATLTCGVIISASDSSFFNEVNGSGVLVRSGKGGTCRIAVPYIFEVANTATTINVSASIGAFTNATPSLSYSASHSFAPFPVPNGSRSLTVILAM
jgi:hypothetical protein